MTVNTEEIISKYREGNIVWLNQTGQHDMPIDKFVHLGAEEVLNRLFRTEDILLSLAQKNPNNVQWVNNYAMAKLVRMLYHYNEKLTDEQIKIVARIRELEGVIEEMSKSQIDVETSNSVPVEQYNDLVEKHKMLAEQYKELEESCSRLYVSVDDYNALKSELTDLTDKNSEFIDELRKNVSQIHTLQDEKERLTAELDALTASKRQLEETLNETETERQRVSETLNEGRDIIDKLNADLDNTKREFEEFKQRTAEAIAKRDKTIKELEQRVYEDEGKQGMLDAANDQITDITNQLNAERERANGQIEELTNQLNAEREKHKSDVNIMTETCKSIKEDNRKEAERHKNEIIQYEQTAQTAVKRADELEKELEKVKVANTTLKEQNKRAEEIISSISELVGFKSRNNIPKNAHTALEGSKMGGIHEVNESIGV